MATGLIPLADAKRSLGIVGTADDADIQRYIEAATPVIENITGPLIAGSKVHTLSGGSGVLVLSGPFSTVTSVVESGVTITDYLADGPAGIIYAGTTVSSRDFKSGVRNIVVTVNVGNAEIPPNVILAARELVRVWWQQGRQGNRPAWGNDVPDGADVPMGFAIPRRVVELLRPHARADGFA
ncbi:head-tail connector protein [Cryobacterium fucosi]|uniref:Phage gp6-like head-tail connector protein n=1 Tax=Cryobacterium fucosi TaxID=1259157 RepID=A0A4R9B3H1_9MICO|nr:head-tail connector protein [Cryobacterium fucosi]TFD74732.1 phage gp6-like head-tail connector protein [Cryobacterium fucosi]